MLSLHLDYETYSEIDLKSSGPYKYAMDSSTEVLMLGWAIGDEEPQVWQPHLEPWMPPKLEEALLNPSVIKKAFNANFERLITKYVLKIDVPIEQWRCVMVKASYLSFTGGLGKVLKAIGLQDKDTRGVSLINTFCKPAPKNHKADRYTPENRAEDWEQFVRYCYTDVVTERLLDKWLNQYPGIEDWDWAQWFEDQRINDRGIEMDIDMAQSAIDIWGHETVELKRKLQGICKLARPTRTPFQRFLNEHVGGFNDTKKDTLQAALKGEIPDYVKEAIQIWLQKEAKATSKYSAVLRVAGEDARARGMFQYKGAARTDRVGGRLIQLQNLKRPFTTAEDIPNLVNAIKCGDSSLLTMLYNMPVSDILGGAIRHVVKAKEGHTLAIADLSSIESVVLGWVAQCDLIDQTFRSNRDSYKVFASKYYNVPYDQVTKQMRSFSKPPVLGCGYMLGWKGLMAYAEGYGVTMEEEDARFAVDTFRGMYKEIPEFWAWIYRAVDHVVNSNRPIEGYRLLISRDKDFLRIRLPSGRNLSYFQPEMEWRPAPWNPKKSIKNFTYMGMDITNKWTKISAHAGLLTENIVQSLAGDILWNGIMNAAKKGLNVILHVHDEIACEVPLETAEQSLQTLKDCLTAQLPWAPDMWLGASGELSERYTKD